jgi:hypothetical protein
VYFAQELPATFYAKVGTPEQRPLDATSRGWTQLFAFAYDTGSVLLVPLIAVGASGAREWRWVTGPVAAALVALAAGTGSIWPVVLLLVGLPATAIGRRSPILVAAALISVGCAFQVGSGGDWMRGYRWMSLVTVPGAMLIGAGIVELGERFEGLRIPTVVFAALAALPQGWFVARYARDPEVSPAQVVDRLNHWLTVARKLQIDRKLRIVDHDMGGMLYYGAPFAQIRDTRGLVDLPFALYGADAGVVRHELFGENPFDVAHAHASTQTALARLPEFRQQFVEIEGYGANHSHRGQFVRRSLILDPPGQRWTGGVLHVRFAGGLSIEGFDAPSPEVGPGAGLYFELAVDRGARTEPFRLLGFLTDGERVIASWDLPPAYDWVPVERWAPGERFHGRFSVPVPEDAPDGPLELGLVAFDADGSVLPAQAVTAPAFVPGKPVLAAGEVRISGVATIVSRDEMGRLALADKTDALAAAGGGLCEDAERSWMLALRHRTRSAQWRDSNRPPVARAIAACWARRAGAGLQEGDELLDRVRELERARSWDPRARDVWTEAEQIGAIAHGRAIGTEDPIVRFQWAEAAVRADPRRSWDRRLAERTRATWVARGAQRPGDRE